MANKYLYDNGSRKVNFTASNTNNLAESGGVIYWSTGENDAHTYLTTTNIDLTEASKIVFSCGVINALSNIAANSFLYINGKNYLLIDTNQASKMYREFTDFERSVGKVGFTFWGRSASGVIQNPTLYIVYPNHIITLKAGEGISAVSPAATNSVTNGSALTINATVKSGYEWKNWTDSSGQQFTTNKQHTFTPTKSATYTANAAKLYTISFNSQGGSSVNSKTVAVGKAYGTLTTPIRSGYTFKGWYTAASGGTLITSSTIFNGTSNITLYAQWTANTYTVTLNPNGGTVSPTSISITYDNTYGILPIPTRNNYEFLGWYTSVSGGTQITPSTKYTTASNTTIYAQWQSNGTVRINIDGKSLLAQVFIFDNNTWHLTQPHTSFLNEWKLNGG